MNTTYKETVALIILFILLISIIPVFMMSDSRDSLVKNYVNDLILVREEANMTLNTLFHKENYHKKLSKKEQNE